LHNSTVTVPGAVIKYNKALSNTPNAVKVRKERERAPLRLAMEQLVNEFKAIVLQDPSYLVSVAQKMVDKLIKAEGADVQLVDEEGDAILNEVMYCSPFLA